MSKPPPRHQRTMSVEPRELFFGTRLACVSLCILGVFNAIQLEHVMRIRRAHVKSHFGCEQCKERRIKCDESKPKCSKCTKRGGPCDYVFIVFQKQSGVANTSLLNQPPTSDASNNASQTLVLDFRSPPNSTEPLARKPSDANTYLNQNVPRSLPLPNYLTTTDQELYSYYQNVVAQDILSTQMYDGLSIWGMTISKYAPSQPFLFSGMLAMASFHLALVQGDQSGSWKRLALQHHNTAIQKYRGMLVDLNHDTIEPALAFSGLVIVTAFARYTAFSRVKGGAIDPIAEFTGITTLFRGMCYLMRLGAFDRLDCRLAPTLRSQVFEAKQCPHEGEAALAKIATELLDNPDFADRIDADEGHDSDDWIPPVQEMSGTFRATKTKTKTAVFRPSEMYAFSLKRLSKQMRRMAGNPDQVGYILIWPYTLPAAYITALEKRRPLAMVLLAHWAAVLHDRREIWWISDFGKVVVNGVQAELGAAWEAYLEWPREHIRQAEKG